MVHDEKGKEGEFRFEDKRRFNPDGTSREKDKEKAEEEKTFQMKDHSDAAMPPINFSTFLLSLASSAQISLGVIPHPVSGRPEVNLVAAKQTVDILGMLEEKTKGNLNPEEDQIVKQILFELRMIYVDLINKTKGEKKA